MNENLWGTTQDSAVFLYFDLFRIFLGSSYIFIYPTLSFLTRRHIHSTEK